VYVGVWDGAAGALAGSIVAGCVEAYKHLSPKMREKRKQDELLRLLFWGQAGIEGLTEPVVPLVTRMASMEHSITTVTRSVGSLSGKIENIEKKVSGNGNNTDDVGDGIRRLLKHFELNVEDKPVQTNRRKDDRSREY
jgi:hypothetical protein